MGHFGGDCVDISNLFLLRGLSPAQVAQCWQQVDSEECCYQKGEVIFDSRLARPALGLVLEGRVQVLHGRVVMNTLTAGDVFGAAALFGEPEEYVSTVRAEVPCRVLFLSQDTVTRWMAAVPSVAENYVRFLSDRIRFLNRRLATLTAGQTDGKLWRFLLSKQDADGRVVIAGGMTELAEKLNMSRSSLYRSLDLLTELGKIRRQGKTIVLIQEEEL